MRRFYKDYFIALPQLVRGDRTFGERCHADERLRDISPFLDSLESIRVLDLANGRLRPQYYLLKADGHRVVGLDIANRYTFGWDDISYRFARWLYRLHIDFPKKVKVDSTLLCGDVSNLPFVDSHFELVTSIAAFEHFLDVPRVVSELYRVMRNESVAYIRIHPFTCPSGGHNVKLMESPMLSIPNKVEPWDHLRSRKIPFHVPLNEWRIHQYVEEFSRRFEILKHYCAMREGAHFLTPNIKAELSEFTEDELTCGAYVIVARKTH